MTSQTGKSVVVVGGTSTLAQYTLRTWLAEQDATVHLIGRSEERLASVAADLKVRFPGSAVTYESADLASVDSIASVATRIVAASAPDIVLIAHGSLGSQDECEQSLQAAFDQLIVTGVSPALWLEAFADRMTHGTLAIIGSVAGDRGRRSNYVYGAAKALIERVAQGLQHRFAGTDLHVVLIKPGPTRTPMTQHLAAAGARLADAQAVAGRIAHAISRKRRVTYAPAIWRVIMVVVRSIPAPVFNRLDL